MPVQALESRASSSGSVMMRGHRLSSRRLNSGRIHSWLHVLKCGYQNRTIGIDFKIRTIELDGKRIKLQIVRDTESSTAAIARGSLSLTFLSARAISALAGPALSGIRRVRNASELSRRPITEEQWVSCSCSTLPMRGVSIVSLISTVCQLIPR